MSLSFIQNRLANQARYKKLIQKRAQERAKLFPERKNLTDIQDSSPQQAHGESNSVEK